MPRVRAGYKRGFKLSKHEFYTVYHFALQYPQWVDEYNSLADTARCIRYDKDRVQASVTPDMVEKAAISRAELKDKMTIVEDTARECGDDLGIYILRAVTTEGATFNYLKTYMHMPYEQTAYYKARRRFYYLLAKKLHYRG